MKNFNQQQIADVNSSFSAFADIPYSESLKSLETTEQFTVEKHAAFGEFASNDDSFPA